MLSLRPRSVPPMSVKRDWEAILRAEGLGENLKQIKPVPRLDRDWTDHFPTRWAAQEEAVERLRLDAQSATDLFSMLADIRWGRHCPSIEPLTDEERLIFDPYCDGETFDRIALSVGLSADAVMRRFYGILSRFTVRRPTIRPHLSRRK